MDADLTRKLGDAGVELGAMGIQWGRRPEELPACSVTPRDLRLLRFLHDFGYATTSTLAALFWGRYGSAVRERLKLLHDVGLVDKLRPRVGMLPYEPVSSIEPRHAPLQPRQLLPGRPQARRHSDRHRRRWKPHRGDDRVRPHPPPVEAARTLAALRLLRHRRLTRQPLRGPGHRAGGPDRLRRRAAGGALRACCRPVIHGVARPRGSARFRRARAGGVHESSAGPGATPSSK
jgi:hypothetical protein